MIAERPNTLSAVLRARAGAPAGDGLDRMAPVVRTRRVPKGARLLAPGQACTFGALVTRGCLRVYLEAADGSERVLYFAPENWWVTGVESRLCRQPASLGIDALETTDVLFVDEANLLLLEAGEPGCNGLIRSLTEKTLVTLQRRFVAGLRNSAVDRYLEFQAVYPGLEGRIPNRQVAAYLGISTRRLMRIRKRLLQPPALAAIDPILTN